MIKVAKFGGSSLADASRIKRTIDIIRSDSTRRFIVVSAPGARHEGDPKITDLLFTLQKDGDDGTSRQQAFNAIRERFEGIVRELGLSGLSPLNISTTLSELSQHSQTSSPDYIASRGEYMMAMILAEALNFSFVDSTRLIRFDENGKCDEAGTDARCKVWLPTYTSAVIPGFYGARPDWSVKTFPRGGSDITGAIIARGCQADVYENWTDVPGLLTADPEIVPHVRTVETLTYAELRELSYMGARVFNDEAVFPIRKAGIPINIRNTNNPDHPGTLVIADATMLKRPPGSIVGIAVRKHFTVITLAKAMMNTELGFIRRVCSVFEEEGVNLEHIPGGIDTVSVITASCELDGKLERIQDGINRDCKPDSMHVRPGLAMISTVGQAMAETPGVAAKLLSAVADVGVNVRMLNQGSSEISIIIGVDNADADEAVRAIHRAFVERTDPHVA